MKKDELYKKLEKKVDCKDTSFSKRLQEYEKEVKQVMKNMTKDDIIDELLSHTERHLLKIKKGDLARDLITIRNIE